jgi:hypothetical protein
VDIKKVGGARNSEAAAAATEQLVCIKPWLLTTVHSLAEGPAGVKQQLPVIRVPLHGWRQPARDKHVSPAVVLLLTNRTTLLQEAPQHTLIATGNAQYQGMRVSWLLCTRVGAAGPVASSSAAAELRNKRMNTPGLCW